jgi:hypothetical protein
MSSGSTMVWVSPGQSSRTPRFLGDKLISSQFDDTVLLSSRGELTDIRAVVMSLSLRVRRFLAAILMAIVTESLLAGLASRAADDGIIKPNAAPPGNHWYYRTKCEYGEAQ